MGYSSVTIDFHVGAELNDEFVIAGCCVSTIISGEIGQEQPSLTIDDKHGIRDADSHSVRIADSRNIRMGDGGVRSSRNGGIRSRSEARCRR